MLTGITFIGVGFATMESFGYYSSTAIHVLVGFILRAIGHGLSLVLLHSYLDEVILCRCSGSIVVLVADFSGWLVRYEEYFLQAVITVVWLVSAAVVHSSVDVFAALGGQALAVLFMMSGWMIFIFFLLRPESDKPYGTIIREVELLRHIVEEK